MIFPQLRIEPLVQVGDKTRLDASASFVSPDQDEITKIEIRPSVSGNFIDVTTRLYLDWIYQVAGDYIVRVRITTGTGLSEETAELDKEITVITAETDRLFSADADLLAHEGDLYRWLREGRSSYIDVHRLAQELILEDLAKRNLTTYMGNRITKDVIWDLKEVREWSKFLTLSLIFKSTANEVNDFFFTKSKDYADLATRAADRATIRIGNPSNAKPDTMPDLKSGRLVRR